MKQEKNHDYSDTNYFTLLDKEERNERTQTNSAGEADN